MKLIKNKVFLAISFLLILAGVSIAALTSDMYRVFVTGEVLQYPVKASTTIYRGAAVGLEASSDGFQYARGYVTSDAFVGFAESKVDNSTGAAGAKKVNVKWRGLVWLNVSNSTTDTQTAVGQILTASDDNTFAFRKDDSTGDVSSDYVIGRVVNVTQGTTRVLTKFDAFFNLDRNAAKRCSAVDASNDCVPY